MYRNSPRPLAEGLTFAQRASKTDRGSASRQPTITVVVPAKNEADNLRAVLPTLPPVHEVILVDGDSVDGTVEAAREIMPDIKVVKQTRKGKGNALACGFEAATGDIIVMFDADGSADPARSPRSSTPLINGADFAKGSRFIEGWRQRRHHPAAAPGQRAACTSWPTCFGQRFSDLCYGYNAFWSELVPAWICPRRCDRAPEGDALGRRLRDRDRHQPAMAAPASVSARCPASSCPASTA